MKCKLVLLSGLVLFLVGSKPFDSRSLHEPVSGKKLSQDADPSDAVICEFSNSLIFSCLANKSIAKVTRASVTVARFHMSEKRSTLEFEPFVPVSSRVRFHLRIKDIDPDLLS